MQENPFSPGGVEFDARQREARVRRMRVFLRPAMAKALSREAGIVADAEQREIRPVVIESPIERT